jgi:outer membrane protein
MNIRNRKTLAVTAIFLTCCATASTAIAYTADIPEEVEKKAGGFIGLAVGSVPDYEGSDDNTTVVAPFGRYQWESGRSVLVAGTGNAERAARLKVNVLTSKTNWRLGPVLQYRRTRDDVDNQQVDDMKEIDAATELGGFLGLQLGKLALRTTLVTDVSDEHDGTIWYFNGDYGIPVGDSLSFSIGAHLTWASDDYMQTYFGVNSGNRGSSTLPSYSASSGIKDTGMTLVGRYKFSPSWGLLGAVNYTRLLNDAEDSPLVKDVGDDNQFKLFLGVTYSF